MTPAATREREGMPFQPAPIGTWRRRSASRRLREVPPVESADDSIRRFVVHLYSYDPERHERRYIEIGSFDNEAEAMRCLGETQMSLMSRQERGEADQRDNVSMVVKEPGVDARNRRRRIEERLRRHS